MTRRHWVLAFTVQARNRNPTDFRWRDSFFQRGLAAVVELDSVSVVNVLTVLPPRGVIDVTLGVYAAPLATHAEASFILAVVVHCLVAVVMVVRGPTINLRQFILHVWRCGVRREALERR
jgi:hypothetical protein